MQLHERIAINPSNWTRMRKELLSNGGTSVLNITKGYKSYQVGYTYYHPFLGYVKVVRVVPPENMVRTEIPSNLLNSLSNKDKDDIRRSKEMGNLELIDLKRDVGIAAHLNLIIMEILGYDQNEVDKKVNDKTSLITNSVLKKNITETFRTAYVEEQIGSLQYEEASRALKVRNPKRSNVVRDLKSISREERVHAVNILGILKRRRAAVKDQDWGKHEEFSDPSKKSESAILWDNLMDELVGILFYKIFAGIAEHNDAMALELIAKDEVEHFWNLMDLLTSGMVLSPASGIVLSTKTSDGKVVVLIDIQKSDRGYGVFSPVNGLMAYNLFGECREESASHYYFGVVLLSLAKESYTPLAFLMFNESVTLQIYVPLGSTAELTLNGSLSKSLKEYQGLRYLSVFAGQKLFRIESDAQFVRLEVTLNDRTEQMLWLKPDEKVLANETLSIFQ